MPEKTYIIAVDVDEIQKYIFSSSQLKAVRGASLIIEQIGEKFRGVRDASQWNCLCYKGGQMVGELFANGVEPQKVCDELNRLMLEIGGPTLTAAMGYTDLNNDAEFADKLKELFTRLEQTKHHSGRFSLRTPPVSGGFIRHCDLCKNAPAEISQNHISYYFGPEDNRYLCASCYRKIKASIQPNSFEKQIVDQYKKNEPEWRSAHVMEELWHGKGEGRVMAMLSMDGNNFGQLLQHLGKEDYSHFSNEIQKLFIDSFVEALKGCIPDQIRDDKNKIVHFMPIIAGGDDLSVWLPAEVAPGFALRFGCTFSRLSEASQSIQRAIRKYRNTDQFGKSFFSGMGPTWPLSLSMGLVFAKPHFPIMAYNRLTRQLRTNAKRLMVNPDARSCGAIDYEIITTAVADNLANLRKNYEIFSLDGISCKLTQRPYSLEGYKKLLELIQVFQKLPRNQCKRIQSEMKKDSYAGEDALLQALRRSEELSENIQTKIEKITGKKSFFDNNNSTPIIDALELIDILPEEEKIC
jgi:hypothetical protein